MKFRSLVIACAVAGTFACANDTAASAATPAVYDRAAPLDLRTDATLSENGATIASLSFRSGDALVHADLVSPKDAGRGMPGVLFVHGLGDDGTSDRSEFLADAEWLARRGVVSLLPDAPWSASHWFDRIRSPKSDAADSASEIVALRRCLDVLASTDGVDRNELAYVGHDFGATYGALLAGVDARPKAFAFVAPGISLLKWFARDTARPAADGGAYAAALRPYDVPVALARSSFKTSLVQFAAHDPYVSAADATAFADALPASGRTVRTYASDHALHVDAATDDRREWLATQLHAR